jgi:hypothetical protein
MVVVVKVDDGWCGIGLTEYQADKAFPGRVGRTINGSGLAPNVVFIVLDDTSYGQFGCCGVTASR